MEPVRGNRPDLNLTPRQNESISETAQRIWNIYGKNVPQGAYNALDAHVKEQYEKIKDYQNNTATSSAMYDHNIDVPRRPRS